MASELYHDTGEPLREIARLKLWEKAAEKSYDALTEIATSEGWGDMAAGTQQAIGEVRSHPIAGPLLDSAIAIEAAALGYVIAPALGGLLTSAEGALATSAPYLPDAVDFVSCMLPGMPENSMLLYGDRFKKRNPFSRLNQGGLGEGTDILRRRGL